MNSKLSFNMLKFFHSIILFSLIFVSCKNENVLEKDVSCKVYSPVCGKDNVTYANECSAQEANVEIKHKLECKLENSCSPDPVCGKYIKCAENGRVCGKDGQSYISSAAANSLGIDVAYKHACFAESKIENCELTCQGPNTDKAAICADDGFRYPSECWAAMFGRLKTSESNCKEGLFTCPKPEEGLCFDDTPCKPKGLACAAYELVIDENTPFESKE